MILEDEWRKLRVIADAELKDRREKEKELSDAGHTSHISAYPIVCSEL